MSRLQKIIKYLAIAFAIFLTFSIISGIMYGISFLGSLVTNEESSITDKLNYLEINDDTLLLLFLGDYQRSIVNESEID